MAKWKALRATFPEEEFEEIKRIKEKYKISYNEIIRSGVKLYLGVTLLKELLATSEYAKGIKIGDRSLSKLLESPEYQAKIEQKITKLVKIIGFELFEKAIEFDERVASITKERKVGRPKRKSRKVGRPTQYD